MLIAAALFLAAAQGELPEAKDTFTARQEDLVLLAAKLGSLHRLSQVCPSYGDVAVFRDRMREVVQGERPIRATREAMIEAFNQQYTATSERHFACGSEAQASFRNAAVDTLAITERLAKGMGEPDPR